MGELWLAIGFSMGVIGTTAVLMPLAFRRRDVERQIRREAACWCNGVLHAARVLAHNGTRDQVAEYLDTIAPDNRHPDDFEPDERRQAGRE